MFNLKSPVRDWDVFCRTLTVDNVMQSARLPFVEKRKIAEVLVAAATKVHHRPASKVTMRKRPSAK